jgi:hypothetical protein
MIWPIDLHNRFNLLAEYLCESGLSESFTLSTLLLDMIEHLLIEYHGLEAFENVRSLNDPMNEPIDSSYPINVNLC